MSFKQRARAKLAKRKHAASVIEFACGAIVLIPVLIIFNDLFVILFNVQLNDATCQDAARVAAIGDPSTAEDRAAAILARVNRQSKVRVRLISVTESQPTPSSPSTGGAVEGSVTVETEIEVALNILRNQQRLRARQTYPFTSVKPAS